jgi:hypothetical protein
MYHLHHESDLTHNHTHSRATLWLVLGSLSVMCDQEVVRECHTTVRRERG